MNRLKTVLAAALATSGIVLAAAPAAAQGVPVVDPGNIAQTVKVVQNGIQQVKQMQEQLKQMQGMAKTIGTDGPLAIATDVLKKAGLDFANSANSPLAPYRAAMPGLLDALPGTEVGKAIGIGQGLAESAKTNIGDARKFALQAFYKPGAATQSEIEQRQGIREAAMRDSVTAGYAMAVYTKNQLGSKTEGGIENTMKALTDGISSAKDLRGDVQSNSAVALAQLQQLTVQNQLLAQLLEVQSTSTMAAQSTSVR